jgi:hypothetical protein
MTQPRDEHGKFIGPMRRADKAKRAFQRSAEQAGAVTPEPEPEPPSPPRPMWSPQAQRGRQRMVDLYRSRGLPSPFMDDPTD